MNATLTLAWLTFQEARRRKMVLVALLMGAVFLMVFGIGFAFVVRNHEQAHTPMATVATGSAIAPILYTFLTMAGLYVVHFLGIMLAIVATVDTVSGEIASHTVQTLVTRPFPRWQLILGKWLGYVGMLTLFTSLLCLGILIESRIISGYFPPNALAGVALILMQVVAVVSLSLLCGVYVSTLTNGVILFLLYGLAFIGSWIEQIGTFFGSSATTTIGIISSLVLPVEALWRLTAYLMQPPLLNNFDFSPFSLGAVPSAAMVVYAGGYIVALLALAMWGFTTRDL
jgi:ABC-type transport system involved in multi-copper enzyme maturation permease subunit